LPDGLHLGLGAPDCDPGFICGTPTRSGTWSFILDVTDSQTASRDSKMFSIVVNPAGSAADAGPDGPGGPDAPPAPDAPLAPDAPPAPDVPLALDAPPPPDAPVVPDAPPVIPDAPGAIDAPGSDGPLTGCGNIEDLGGPLGAVEPGDTAYVAVGRVPLVLDDSGNPWIATLERRDMDGFYFTFVRKWNGLDAWEQVGPGIAYGGSDGAGGLAALALDAGGQPVVAAMRRDASQILVMQVVRFDGAGWQDLGLPITRPLGGASLARAPSGDIVVAWPAIFPTMPLYRLEIAKYASGAWHTLADAPALQRQSLMVYDPNIAVTPAGEVVVAWSEMGSVSGGPVNPTFVDRLAGTVVTPLGDAVDTTPNVVRPFPSVAVDSQGTIYLAYAPTQPGQYSSGIQVVTWTGSAWQDVGGLLPGSEGDAFPPFNLTIHPQTHQPVVGAPYRYDASNVAAGVWTFDGATWNQLCHDLIDFTLEASVAVDAQGRYVVVGQVLTGVQTGTTIVRRITP